MCVCVYRSKVSVEDLFDFFFLSIGFIIEAFMDTLIFIMLD